jgi:hypothetical protein
MGEDSRRRASPKLPWLRAFLTVIVAAVLPATLLYVYFFTRQTQTFERRNLRVLENVASQLQAEVENAAAILRHAPRALDPDDPASAAQRLRSYLEIGTRLRPVALPDRPATDGGPAATTDTGCAVDARVDGSGGRGSLVLETTTPAGASRPCAVEGLRASRSLREAASLDRARPEFDALLLLDENGAVLAQRGDWDDTIAMHPVLTDARGRRVEPRALAGLPVTGAPAPEEAGADPLERRWFDPQFSHLLRTRVLTDEYLTFAAPVRLALPEPTSTPPIPLLLAGLVRESRFRHDAFALGPTSLALIVTGLAFAVLALPYVKIRFASRRERVRWIDMWSLALASFAGTALLTLTGLHLLGRHALLRQMDADLVALAHDVQGHVALEARAVDEQLFVAGDALARASGPQTAEPQVLARKDLVFTHPYFNTIFLTDVRGEQIRKWTPRTISTPLIRIPTTGWLGRALAMPEPLRPQTPRWRYVFDSIDSTTTGSELAVFATPWRVPQPGRPESNLGPAVPTSERAGVAAIATILRSLSAPVVPQPFQIVVLDGAAHVLFRSDGERNRREDFFEELGEARPALGMSGDCDGAPQERRYLGHAKRMLACPLEDLPVGAAGPRPATLVAFYDVEMVEAAAVDPLLAGLFWGALVGAVCFAAAVLARGLWRGAVDWLWPTPRRARLYLSGALFFLALSIVLGVLTVLTPGPWIGRSLLVVPGLAVFALPFCARFARTWPWLREVDADDDPTPLDRRLHPWTYIACATLGFFALAALPCVVAFRDAFQAENAALRSSIDRAFERARDLASARDRAGYLAVAGREAGGVPVDCVASASRERPECRFRDRIVATPDRVERLAAGGGGELALYPPPGYAAQPLRPETVERADCGAFFRGDTDRGPQHFFSVVAAACLPAPSKAIAKLRREVLAVDAAAAGEQAPPSFVSRRHAIRPLAAAVWLGVVLVAIATVAVSVSRRILGLDLDGDGVIDRGEELEWAIAQLRAEPAARGGQFVVEEPTVPRRWLLLRPPRRVLRLVGDPGTALVVDLSLLPAEEPRIEQKPEADKQFVIVRGIETRLGDPAWAREILRFVSAPRPNPLFLVCRVDPLYYLDTRAIPKQSAAASSRDDLLASWSRALLDFEHVRFRVTPLREACHALGVPAPDAGGAGGPGARLLRLFRDVRRRGLRAVIAERRRARLLRFLADECRWSDELIGIGRCLASRPDFDGLDRNRLADVLLDAASAHYQSLWCQCSEEERLLLVQLAQEGLANPRQVDVLRRLRSRRLVRADPHFRLMNESFQRFVLEAESPEQIALWERPQGEATSARVRGPLLVLATIVLGLLLLTQQAFVTTTLGFAAGAAGTVGALQGLLARFQASRTAG